MHIAGWTGCGAFRNARNALLGLVAVFPDEFQVEVNEFPTRDEYMAWLEENRADVGAPDHRTSPLVYFERGNVLGGRDDTIAWCKSILSTNDSPTSSAPRVDQWNPNHEYDYDLIIIGGGSGGLACSKEAMRLNPDLKVAVLDFVKPSPQGSKWGLGGTCVNVGCIPKKLMHTASLLGEHAHDAVHYGWEGGNAAVNNWDTLRTNVQNHIKGLNFGYRVQLREQGVKYMNKLGRFVDSHTLELSDSKGTKTTTAARFVIAVGGRPTPLSCPGGEFAISSDDIFMKETAPGKTCVVGAGYVALECGGFIQGLRQGDVTVLVRSIPLRGFDREMVDKLVPSLTASGVRMLVGVLPESITKLDNGKFLVRMSNGEEDEFDTVLGATGRTADTEGLNLQAAGVEVDPGNKKVICQDEQSSVPHIYCIGDAMYGCPELTPVAIQAGQLLAQRLFGGSRKVMEYEKVATVVFTPLEYGCVGLTEERAREVYGDAVDAYVSEFTPLEWTVAEDNHSAVKCFTKVLVNTRKDNAVIGMHIASPNAGEIIQGMSVAFRKGLKYQDLLDTVGLHPTIAEEFTTMTISKSSGADFQKAGC